MTSIGIGTSRLSMNQGASLGGEGVIGISSETVF
jgi:hypothetical protein